MTQLVEYLTSEKETEAEILLLKGTVCAEENDPFACMGAMDEWWPRITDAIRAGNEVCVTG